MRREMKFYELLLLRDDIASQKQNSPAFRYFFESKIQLFHSKNAIALSLLHSKLKEIKTQYCLVDDKGQPIIKEVNGKQEVVYPSKEANDLCKKEITEFLNRSVTVEL